MQNHVLCSLCKVVHLFLVCNGTSQALQADDKIREIMHKQQETVTVVKPIEKTDDEMKRRLLEQYSHVSENEDRLVHLIS